MAKNELPCMVFVVIVSAPSDVNVGYWEVILPMLNDLRMAYGDEAVSSTSLKHEVKTNANIERNIAKLFFIQICTLRSICKNSNNFRFKRYLKLYL